MKTSLMGVNAATLTWGIDLHVLINGHVLFKIGEDRYAMTVPTMNEVVQVIKIMVDGEDSLVITKQKLVEDGKPTDHVVMSRKNTEWIFTDYLHDVKTEDITFSDIEEVTSILNRYLYEVV